MPRPPYKFFTPLNKRRHELITKEFESKAGLTPDEKSEMEMLQKVCYAMIDYRYPLQVPNELLEAELRAKGHKYEIRHFDKDESKGVDEIVAEDVSFHMESLDDNCYWFAVTWADGERLSWTLHTKKAHISVVMQDKPSTKKDYGPFVMRFATCSCTIIKPCSRHCSCANRSMSGGCMRCCSYGSEEQKKAMAKEIAEAVEAHFKEQEA